MNDGVLLATYSFGDILASIAGPNGAFPLGSGAGNAEEGITIEMLEDKNTMTLGADGQAMHSLHMGQAGRVRVALLKTSPVNALLSAMYNADRQSSILWGKNQLVITNPITGDYYSCFGCAFARFPNNVYAKDGGRIEWDFLSAWVDPLLAAGAIFQVAA